MTQYSEHQICSSPRAGSIVVSVRCGTEKREKREKCVSVCFCHMNHQDAPAGSIPYHSPVNSWIICVTCGFLFSQLHMCTVHEREEHFQKFNYSFIFVFL